MRLNLMAPSWRGAGPSSSSAAAKVAKWKRKGSKGDLYHLQKNAGFSPLALSLAAVALFSFTGFVASHLWSAVAAEGSKREGIAAVAVGKSPGLKWNTDGWLEPELQHQQYGDDFPTFFEAQISGLRSATAVNVALRRTGVNERSRPNLNTQVIRITRSPGSAARGRTEGRVTSAGLWGSKREDDNADGSAEQAALDEATARHSVGNVGVTAGSQTGAEATGSGKGQVPTWLGNEGGWGAKKADEEESDGQESDGQTVAVGEDGELETELADEARKVSSAGLLEFLWKRREESESTPRERASKGGERIPGKDRARNPWDDGDDRPRKLLLPRGGLQGVGGQLLRGDWRSGHKEAESEGTAGMSESGQHMVKSKTESKSKTETATKEKEGTDQKQSKGDERRAEKASDGQERPWYQWQWRSRVSEADDRSHRGVKSARVQEKESPSKEQPKEVSAAAQLSKFWLKGAAQEKHESHAERMHYASAE